jgi:hypothetical protein
MAADDRTGAEPVVFAGRVLDRYRRVCAFVNLEERAHSAPR